LTLHTKVSIIVRKRELAAASRTCRLLVGSAEGDAVGVAEVGVEVGLAVKPELKLINIYI
jgi:hypothetical protein